MKLFSYELSPLTIKIYEYLAGYRHYARDKLYELQPELREHLAWWDDPLRIKLIMEPPNPEPEENHDVHTEHCCYNCGCKYGMDLTAEEESEFTGQDETGHVQCPVVSKAKRQSFQCSGHCGY